MSATNSTVVVTAIAAIVSTHPVIATLFAILVWSFYLIELIDRIVRLAYQRRIGILIRKALTDTSPETHRRIIELIRALHG